MNSTIATSPSAQPEIGAATSTFSAGSAAIGIAHAGATSPQATDRGSPPPRPWPRSPTGLVSLRRPAEELAAELDRYLTLPSAQVTLFSVMDKLARQTGGQLLTSTEAILQAQRDQSKAVAARVESALLRGWHAGLLEVFHDGGVRITPAGEWYVKEGRARRLALWKTNPRLDLGEICAIVQVEDGDGPVFEVPLELVALPARAHQVPQRVDILPEDVPAAARRGRPAKKIEVAPVWAGLLCAPRAVFGACA